MLAVSKAEMRRGIPSGFYARRGILWEPSPHAPERMAVYGPESAGSPVGRMANTLTTEVDVSGGEWASRQSCPCRSPRDRDEIRDLGGAAPGQGDARPTMPVSVNDGDRYIGRLVLRAFCLDANLRRCVRRMALV